MISTQQLYDQWIKLSPESYHALDINRFYLFVSALLSRGKSDKPSDWLRGEITKDRPELSKEVVDHYCYLYDHIKDFMKVYRKHRNYLAGLKYR